MRNRYSATLAFVAFLPPNTNFAGLVFAQSGDPGRGTVARIKVHGKGLEGNLAGPARRGRFYLLSFELQGATRSPISRHLHAAWLYG